MTREEHPRADLIRTCLRMRLTRSLSYPLGAEAISQALADIPQYSDPWIAFNNHPMTMGYGSPKELAGFNQVISAQWYRHGGWSLTVFAIRSEVRAVGKSLLLTDGLTPVCDWFRTERSETWFIGMREFRVGCTSVRRQQLHCWKSVPAVRLISA